MIVALPWWKHFPVTGHLCRELTGHRWISPQKGRWGGALMFPLICVWINSWVSNREAGDLRRYQALCDVAVMIVVIAVDIHGVSIHTWLHLKNKNKNAERHTAHTVVWWPNPKQWVIVHTSDLMMIIRQSIYILSIITREMGKLKTHSPTYCIMDNWENMPDLTHTHGDMQCCWPITFGYI